MTTPEQTEPDEPLPESVVARAAAENLGLLRTTVRVKKVGKVAAATMWLSLVLLLACFILPGLGYLWQYRGSAVFNRKLLSRRLYLFEHGLLVADANGPIHAARWDAMTVLQRIVNRELAGTVLRTDYTYTVILGDGSSFKLDNLYETPGVWGPKIQEEITRAYLPGVMSALESGRPVVFSDITLSTTGLANIKRGELAWAEIQEIKVSNGVVIVRKAGKLTPLTGTPVSQIPNFFVFLAAARTLHDRTARQAGAAV